MLSTRQTKSSEIPKLKQLLEAQKLCFNDINDQGVSLFSVTRDKEVIGYFGFEIFNHLALFRSMVVTPQARLKGYGTLIWEQAKRKLKASEVSEVYLLTDTAAPFFIKQGFDKIPRSSTPEPIASTTEFIEFCPEDSICMKITI